MVAMRAIRAWTGAEGKVRPGDKIEVDETRAQELEGRIVETRRVLAPESSHRTERVERHVTPRARRIGEPVAPTQPETATASYEDKGGATAAERGGHVGAVDATEGARKLAESEGIDLAGISGTGSGGRITANDVRRHLRSAE